MPQPTQATITTCTLILIKDQPYKVFVEPNEGLVEQELKALDAVGIKVSNPTDGSDEETKGDVTVQTLPHIHPCMA